MKGAAIFLALACCLTTSGDAEEAGASPLTRLTDRYSPVVVRLCATENADCRSARVGLVDGKLTIAGDLSKDEALTTLVLLSAATSKRNIESGKVRPSSTHAAGYVFTYTQGKSSSLNSDGGGRNISWEDL